MEQDFTKGLSVCIGNYGYYNDRRAASRKFELLGTGEESMPDRPFPVDLGNLECAVLPGTPCQNRIVFAGVSAKTGEIEAT